MQTFKKLPTTAPNRKGIIKGIKLSTGRLLKTHSERNPRVFLRGQASEQEIETSLGFEVPAIESRELQKIHLHRYHRRSWGVRGEHASFPAPRRLASWSFLSSLKKRRFPQSAKGHREDSPSSSSR